MAKEVELLLQVDQKRLASWRESAKRCGMTLNDWLILGITLADQLRIVEGAAQLPENGTAIDPILAEAVRRAAVGQPWEHKATLLLGAGALAPNIYNESNLPQPIKVVRSSADNANDLMVEHGLPRTAKRKSKMHAVIGGNAYTWYETALLLYVHDLTVDGWATTKTSDLCELCGSTPTTINETLRRLKILGRVEELPGQNRRLKKVRMVRLQPAIHTAIRSGDIQLLNGIRKIQAIPEREEEESIVDETKNHDPRYTAMMERIAAEHQKLVDAGSIYK